MKSFEGHSTMMQAQVALLYIVWANIDFFFFKAAQLLQ